MKNKTVIIGAITALVLGVAAFFTGGQDIEAGLKAFCENAPTSAETPVPEQPTE